MGGIIFSGLSDAEATLKNIAKDERRTCAFVSFGLLEFNIVIRDSYSNRMILMYRRKHEGIKADHCQLDFLFLSS